MSGITVTLGLDAKKFQSGAAAAAGYAKNFATSMQASMMSALGPIAVALSVFTFLKETFQSAGQVADLSDKYDVSSDSLQRVAYAAKKVGIEMDGVGAIIKGLNRGFAGAFSDPKQIKDLLALGFTMEEIKKGGPGAEEALLRLSSGLDKSAVKAQYLQKLQSAFGKSAVDIMGMLSLSTEGMAQAFGQATVMSEAQIQAADQMGETWDDLISALKPIGMAVVGIFGMILGAVGAVLTGVFILATALQSYILDKLSTILKLMSQLAKLSPAMRMLGISEGLEDASKFARSASEYTNELVIKAGKWNDKSYALIKAGFNATTGGAFMDPKDKKKSNKRIGGVDFEMPTEKAKSGKASTVGVSTIQAVGGGGLVGGGYDPVVAVSKDILTVQQQQLAEMKVQSSLLKNSSPISN